MRFDRILLVILFILLPSGIFPQGALLDDGQSGGGFLAGTAVSSEGLFIHGGVMATFAGRVDIGALVSRELFDKYNYSATALGIWTEVYVLREDHSKKIPLSMSISYQVSGTSSLNFSTFGASIYKRSGESRRSFIQPAVSIFYTLETQHHPRTSALGFALGISVASKIGKYAVFSFTPSFAHVREENSAGMTLVFMFSDTPRSKEDGKSQFDF